MIARWVAPESLVAELVQENPGRDVRRACREFSDWTATHDCSAPERMLRIRIGWDRYAVAEGGRPASANPPIEYGERGDEHVKDFWCDRIFRMLAGELTLEDAVRIERPEAW